VWFRPMTDTQMTNLETLEPQAAAPYLDVMIAGDLVLVKNQNPEMLKRSIKYRELFELFANMEKPERMVNYSMVTALMLTSIARRTADAEIRTKLFDQKNDLLVAMLNNHDLRRFFGLKYLKSKNFKVTDYCAKCSEANTIGEVPKFRWKFCRDCKVDRTYYNVVSVHHRFKDGFFTVYLGQQALPLLRGVKLKTTDPLEKYSEEGRYKRYLYEPRTFSAFLPQAAQKLHKMLIEKLGPQSEPRGSTH
jgi:hypothetical protein